MKIKTKVPIKYKGETVSAGKITEVDDKFGKALIRKHFAEKIAEPKKEAKEEPKEEK